jgi:hypothetical protein
MLIHDRVQRSGSQWAAGERRADGSHERLKSALQDRYTVGRGIGAGDLATVFLARDLKHDRVLNPCRWRPGRASGSWIQGREAALRV